MNTQTFDSNPVGNASKNCNRQFHSSVPHPVTSRPWRGRFDHQKFSIVQHSTLADQGLTPNEFRLLEIMRSLSRKGEVEVSIGYIARLLGWTPGWVRTLKNRLKAKGYLEFTAQYHPVRGDQIANLYQIKGCRQPLKKPYPTPLHDRDAQVLRKTKASTVANAPVPRAREGASIQTPPAGSPDELPVPTGPPIPAAAPAKAASKPRRRWNGRSQSVIRQLTPVQKAAERIMAALGVAPSLWKTREAIAYAIRQWAQQEPDKGLEEAVAALVACWRDYQRTPMRFRWGLISFFGENHWQERSSWPVDRRAQQEQRLAAEARVGSAGPTGSYGAMKAAEEREEQESYAMWAGMSEGFRKANPWKVFQ